MQRIVFYQKQNGIAREKRRLAARDDRFTAAADRNNDCGSRQANFAQTLAMQFIVLWQDGFADRGFLLIDGGKTLDLRRVDLML